MTTGNCQVDQGRCGKGLEPFEGVAFHLACLIGQLHNADRHGERGVLGKIEKLVDERRNRYPHRLRQNDVLHGAQIGEAAALGRLHLLFRDGENAGADILGNKGRGVDGQGDQCRRQIQSRCCSAIH